MFRSITFNGSTFFPMWSVEHIGCRISTCDDSFFIIAKSYKENPITFLNTNINARRPCIENFSYLRYSILKIIKTTI